MISTVYQVWAYKALDLFKNLPVTVEYQTSYTGTDWIYGYIVSRSFTTDHAEFVIRCFPQQRVITNPVEGVTRIRLRAMYGSEVLQCVGNSATIFSDNLIPMEVKLYITWTLG
jgi:hypothetical protein